MVTRSELRWVLLPLGASLGLLIGMIWDVVYYILPYLLFVLLGWLLLVREESLLTPGNSETG
jgi:hypothetical protein